MRLSDLEYELPPELIAQAPLQRRDGSRLLVFDRAKGEVRHRRFSDLPEELRKEDLVVLNNTKVVPGRLNLRRMSGGKAEVFLVEPRGGDIWEALCRPSRRLSVGERLDSVDPEFGLVELIEDCGSGRWLVRVEGKMGGELPLPPYIHEPLVDESRYQTIFANVSGSAAAPTAGLHLTSDLLSYLNHVFVTLHIGPDTFRPVTEMELEKHRMHGERYKVSSESWKRISDADRVVAIGTTSVRTLEAIAHSVSELGSPCLDGRTDLFIQPGHIFHVVDALVTNFHLPCSTLLALVMAFAGIEQTRDLYRIAVEDRYRFYSFGDAMLVL